MSESLEQAALRIAREAHLRNPEFNLWNEDAIVRHIQQFCIDFAHRIAEWLAEEQEVFAYGSERTGKADVSILPFYGSFPLYRHPAPKQEVPEACDPDAGAEEALAKFFGLSDPACGKEETK